jgi:uncharacterized protein
LSSWSKDYHKSVLRIGSHNYEGKKGSVFVAEGITPFPVGGGFAAGKDPKDLAANQSVGYEEARPSGWDPAERVKDQEIDGSEGEILYAMLGMFLCTGGRVED